MSWKLKRTSQCDKCPWKKDVNPFDIPNGYDLEKHKGLKNTIAEPGHYDPDNRQLKVMSCHEIEDSHCVGWFLFECT